MDGKRLERDMINNNIIMSYYAPLDVLSRREKTLIKRKTMELNIHYRKRIEMIMIGNIYIALFKYMLVIPYWLK